MLKELQNEFLKYFYLAHIHSKDNLMFTTRRSFELKKTKKTPQKTAKFRFVLFLFKRFNPLLIKQAH